MLQISDPHALQEQCLAWRAEGLRTVLVPTMGYFHQGHEQLMTMGRELGDKVIVSLFVNPSQFGPSEDLATYPRDLERDTAIAAGNKVDVLFTPTPETMYPSGFDTWVEVPGLSSLHCGQTRPGHFKGVCTIVLKLLNLCMPRHAVFGQKDWQQFTIISRMVKDLCLPIHIEGCPIVREADGLALSSRNSYLSADERALAPNIYSGLSLARQLFAGGEVDTAELRKRILDYWQEKMPAGRVDYLRLVDAVTLKEVEEATPNTRILTAFYIGKTRLIDNVSLG